MLFRCGNFERLHIELYIGDSNYCMLGSLYNCIIYDRKSTQRDPGKSV